MKFKVGDKVRVYDSYSTFKGCVVQVRPEILVVEAKDHGVTKHYHYKQCRKLVKKKGKK